MCEKGCEATAWAAKAACVLTLTEWGLLACEKGNGNATAAAAAEFPEVTATWAAAAAATTELFKFGGGCCWCSGGGPCRGNVGATEFPMLVFKVLHLLGGTFPIRRFPVLGFLSLFRIGSFKFVTCGGAGPWAVVVETEKELKIVVYEEDNLGVVIDEERVVEAEEQYHVHLML